MIHFERLVLLRQPVVSGRPVGETVKLTQLCPPSAAVLHPHKTLVSTPPVLTQKKKKLIK